MSLLAIGVNSLVERLCSAMPWKGARIAFKPCFLALALSSVAVAPAALAQQSGCWTTVGSAGTVDEEDLNTVALDSNATGVRSTVSSATVNVRYNVVNVPNLDLAGAGKVLVARMADNGTASQVIVQLRRLNVSTGQDTLLGTLDSNSFPPSTVAQRREVELCAIGALDFTNNVYYVDVAIVKSAVGGTPLIRTVQLCPRGCVD